MYTFIVSLFCYFFLLRWNKNNKVKQMMIYNMTNSEYNKMMEEKMKNYNSYEYSELYLM